MPIECAPRDVARAGGRADQTVQSSKTGGGAESVRRPSGETPIRIDLPNGQWPMRTDVLGRARVTVPRGERGSV